MTHGITNTTLNTPSRRSNLQCNCLGALTDDVIVVSMRCKYALNKAGSIVIFRNALFFVRADKLGDPFEGALSKVNFKLRPTIYKGLPSDAFQRIGDARKEIRKFMLISCWHLNDHESAAMWKLYSREQDGVAIRTSFHHFKDSFLGGSDVHVGKIQYADYETVFIPEDNAVAPFLIKRKSFAHENEVRALIFDLPTDNETIDLSQNLYDVGAYHPVDISLTNPGSHRSSLRRRLVCRACPVSSQQVWAESFGQKASFS